MNKRFRPGFALYAALVSALCWPALSPAASTTLTADSNFGPYNVSFFEGGVGIARPLSAESQLLAPGSPWTISGWLRSVRRQSGAAMVAAVGGEGGYGLSLIDGIPSLVVGSVVFARGDAALDPGRWYALAAVYDGKTARLYVDGRELDSKATATPRARPIL